MANAPSGDELQVALEAWLDVFDEDEGASVNDERLRELLAETLGDDSGDAKVVSAQVVSLTNVKDYDGAYKVLGTLNVESLHRTDSRDPDTFGPNDIADWKEELIIAAELQGGAWRVIEVSLVP